MSQPKLFKHQDDCIQEMFNSKEKFNICKLFCGTGKTLLWTTYLEEAAEVSQSILAIAAFPRIDLVNQYNNEYYENCSKYSKYIISSEHQSKSDIANLRKFLRIPLHKLILVTHTSMWSLLEALKDFKTQPTVVIIDEVHHFNTKKSIEMLRNINTYRVFGFTATPAKLHPKPIYSYGYGEAMRDGNCKQFEIDLYNTTDKKTPENIYRGLVYLAEKTGVKNILCFHAFSKIEEKNGRTSVSTYKELNPKLVEKNTRFTAGLRSHVITGEMKSRERSLLLTKISKAPSNQLNIIHTCNTVSEGINTKSIGSICFVDPKGSTVAIIQAIGRCTRLDGTENPARVFILNFGDLDDYRSILGVLEFLSQDNPELYEASVKSPKKLVPADYKFHLAHVIVNENCGDIYKGKFIDDLELPKGVVAVECSDSIDGEIVTTETPKDSGVDKWIYFYTNQNTGEILEVLGSSKERPKNLTKPKKFIKFPTGVPEKLKLDLDVETVLDDIWETETLVQGFFQLREKSSDDEKVVEAFDSFFKSTDWEIITPGMFKKYLKDIKDPEVKSIKYKWTRLDRLRELIEGIKANNGQMPGALEEGGKFLSELKAIRRGERAELPGVTKSEEQVLEEFLGPKWYSKASSRNDNSTVSMSATELKQRNLLLCYFNDNDPRGLELLRKIQKGDALPSINRMLFSIDPKWKSLQPSTLKDIYLSMDDQFYECYQYDDTLSIAPTTLGSCPALSESAEYRDVRTTPTVPEEHSAVLTILDFSEAIEDGRPLDTELKKEIKLLYRNLNEHLLFFLEKNNITTERLLEYLT